MNGRIQKARYVVGIVVGHARWEGAFLQFGHSLFYVGNYFAGIGAGPLFQHDSRRGPTVGFGKHAVIQRTKFHIGHVFQAQQRSVCIGPQHNVFVLRRFEKLTGITEYVLEHLRVAVGTFARFAGGGFYVLLPNTGNHFVGRYS